MQKPSVGDIGGVVAECGLFVIQHVVCGDRFLYGKGVIVGHDTHNGVDIKSVYIVGLQFVVDGIEVDILNLIAKELGVELEIVQMDFDSVLTAIQSAKYDCGMSGITANEERKKNMLFTDPYYNAAQVIVVKADSAIKSKADLKDKTVSVQTGTTAETGCQDEGIAVQAFAANADAKAALTTGKVDAWVVDNLTAVQMVTEGDGLTILEEKMTEEPYAFAFAFGSEDLVAEINKIQAKMIEDGTIQGIFDNYGETYMKP